MIYLVIVMTVIMIVGSIAILFQKTLRKAALISGIVSLMAAGFFVLMKAYDVAITEASIGAMLTTALYFFSIKRIEEIEKTGESETRDEGK